MIYGELIASRSPQYGRISTCGNRVHIWFDDGNRLITRGSPTGFDGAGVDDEFVPVTAVIYGIR
jgi:hypothetical protein